MQVEWYGQSAFRLSADDISLVVDPFADLSPLGARGIRFDYPQIPPLPADLVLVTHEHLDHNGVSAVPGSPPILRSTAGRLESPLGTVVAVASEHDQAAGTERGPNTIFVFDLDGLRVCHFGDFGQAELRPEQAAAIGEVDLLLLPVGGGPTIGAEQAEVVVRRLAPRWAVPMHYRTHRVGFLESAEDFLDRFEHVLRLENSKFDTSELPDRAPLIVVPTAP